MSRSHLTIGSIFFLMMFGLVSGCSPNLLDDPDADGVGRPIDVCADTPAGEVVDGNGCAASQLDGDNDGVSDADDQCPETPTDASVDANGCAASQLDADSDGVSDADDQCPDTVAGATVDANGCAASQLDGDSDGVSDADDQCPETPAGATIDENGCAASQLDGDGDGVSDADDQCPDTPAGQEVNNVGCRKTAADSDGDGVPDSQDLCPGTPAGTAVDANGCPSQLTVSIEVTASCVAVVSLNAVVSNANGAVTYSWLLTQVGTAGSLTIASADTQQTSATFSCDAAGSFTVQVTVTDTVGSATATTTISPPELMCGCTDFTPDIDYLAGTQNNDIFDGTLFFDGSVNTWVNTVNDSDWADGLAGTDVANIELEEGTSVAPSLASIEIVNITVTDANGLGGGAVTFSAGKTIGMTIVNAVDCNDTLNVADLKAIPALGISHGDQSVTLAFGADIASGAADAIDITLSQVSGGTVTIPGVEFANIDLAGTTTNTIDALNMADLTKITVTGSQDLTITNPIAATTFDELDAGLITGSITITFPDAASDTVLLATGTGDDDITAGAAADVVTATLGAGDDRLALGGFTDGTDSADGGAGADTIALPNAAATGVTSALAGLTNFEILELTDGISGDLTLSHFGSITKLILTAAIAGDSTVTVPSGMEIVVEASDVGAHALSITSGPLAFDALTLSLENGGAAFGDLATLSHIESLAINSGGAAANTLTGLTFAPSAGVPYTTITITGDQNLTLGTVTKGTPIDASAFTGNLSLTLARAGTVTGGSGDDTIAGSSFGDSLIGGDGNDTLTGAASADAVSGGAGEDTIIGSVGSDLLTGGADADTFVFAGGDVGTVPSDMEYDVISDWETASDIIDFAAALTIVQNTAGGAGVATISAEGICAFDVSDNTLAERIIAAEAGISAGGDAAAGQFCVFQVSGDSYVFISDGTDGIDANDVLIKLANVTGLSDTTLAGGNLTIQ